ncbi:MAG: aminoacyl-tRNA hydrolase [Steroidobacteraceae bacterium]
MPGLPLKLVVGLGNPGSEYAHTRHNAGFWFVDELARRHGGRWRTESRFNVDLARIDLAGGQVWLAKPQAFMNRSGDVTAAVANFYKIGADEVLVAHDEIDLPLGALRLKEGGGAGGHNGLRDLIAKLGELFWRLRIGVGHPGSRDLVTGFVLNRASSAEQAVLEAAVLDAADCLPQLLEQGAQLTMQKLHSRPGIA